MKARTRLCLISKCPGAPLTYPSHKARKTALQAVLSVKIHTPEMSLIYARLYFACVAHVVCFWCFEPIDDTLRDSVFRHLSGALSYLLKPMLALFEAALPVALELKPPAFECRLEDQSYLSPLGCRERPREILVSPHDASGSLQAFRGRLFFSYYEMQKPARKGGFGAFIEGLAPDVGRP